MNWIKLFYTPGGDDEPVSSSDAEEKIEKAAEEGHEESPGFFGKIKQALQDWSNDDAEDLEYDDERV